MRKNETIRLLKMLKRKTIRAISKIPIVSNIMFLLSEIISLKMILSNITEMILDKAKEHGKDSDIRVAYVGHYLSSKSISDEDSYLKLISCISSKKVIISWYKPTLIIALEYGRYPTYLMLRLILRFSKIPVLFFSWENFNIPEYSVYKNYLRGLPRSASFGYVYDSPYANRLPLWLFYIFTAEFIANSSLADISAKLTNIESNSFLNKSKFAALIARYDGFGAVTRSEIVNSLNSINKVSCPGDFLHNDNSLIEYYKDNKKEYLKDFVFNICPENSFTPGYITEKIFESFEAGCIPVYWKGDNPEPDILNPNRIIFWQENSDNKENIITIRKLYKDKGAREVFFKEPIFVKGADERIYKYFLLLRGKVAELLGSDRINT